MFGSRAVTRDLNLNGKEDSDLHHQNRQQQMSTGLPRLRSAPSTLLGEVCEDSLPHRSAGTDSALMFTMFPPSAGDTAQRSPRFAVEMERRAAAAAAASGAVCQAREHQHLPSHRAPAAASNEVYRTARSLAMEEEQERSGLNSSSLIRHSSSPAGLFSHLNTENGYAVVGGVGGFRLGTCAVGEAAMADARLRGQLSFSSRQSSSSMLMTQNPETGEEDIGGSSTEEGGLGNGGRCYVPGYPEASWDDDLSLLPGGFSRMKRARDPCEARIEDVRSHDQILSRQYSLPITSSEMPAILQFQDAVPCKIRAKRGCATHPRSIAERVRRTRISERIRKLQELVPNMDKQTNISDMLDLAVEYIKDLEKQVKTLSESRANCTCSCEQKPQRTKV